MKGRNQNDTVHVNKFAQVLVSRLSQDIGLNLTQRELVCNAVNQLHAKLYEQEDFVIFSTYWMTHTEQLEELSSKLELIPNFVNMRLPEEILNKLREIMFYAKGEREFINGRLTHKRFQIEDNDIGYTQIILSCVLSYLLPYLQWNNVSYNGYIEAKGKHLEPDTYFELSGAECHEFRNNPLHGYALVTNYVIVVKGERSGALFKTHEEIQFEQSMQIDLEIQQELDQEYEFDYPEIG